MSKKTVPDLKELFKQAAEIAQQVPESMQEAAFNRAIDLLTGELQADQEKNDVTPKGKATKKKKIKDKEDKEISSADELLALIDSTKHPGVTSASKVLDRSLMILQIALREHSVDGLSPSAIANILTEKFRISTTKYAVGMALGKATALVNRIPEGQGYLYKIMAPGEEYLAHLGESSGTSSAVPKKKRTKKKKTTDNVEQSKKTSSKKIPGKSSQKKSGVGPKSAVLNLIDSGFFNKGKTSPEVQAYLKNKRVLNFSADQLRVVLLRLARDQRLDRDLNEEGQYEYRKAQT